MGLSRAWGMRRGRTSQSIIREYIARCKEDRHHLDVPAAALTADEPPVLGDVNEDHAVPELQFLECLYRLMIAIEAMDGQRLFAARSCVTNGPCGLTTCHARRIASQLRSSWPSRGR